ncbi:membrane cofactor protein-like isoform X2 [Pteropus medius]|uniref:membrane cofactor protein-like isoform X2 n=1 Tax=Pteropus vampyrus TaxID=132908 RepID=UPI00196A3B73|nr:membrane cofactor protein-like isoform X2 [Pteropus giganteus]
MLPQLLFVSLITHGQLSRRLVQVKKSCPQLEEPLNGQIIYVNRTFQFGSQAHYVCNEGFILRGTKILYCELSGSNVDWSDNPPECEKIICRAPPNIANGKYTNSDKPIFDYNEVVTYSCNPSMGQDKYSLVGESKLTCRGLWSSDPPECKVVKCQDPVVENGRLVSGFGRKYYYKDEVAFECNQGSHLKGNNTIFCGANSVWEPEMPECTKETTENVTSSDESQANDVKDLDGGLTAVIVLTLLALQ